MRRPRGLALWLALLAVFARGLLPGGVMLAHDGGSGFGLTVALCSGGQVRIHSIADTASPAAQAGGECVYAAAALPALPPTLALTPSAADRSSEPAPASPLRVAQSPRPAPPPARGPPQYS
nr:DUF2946 family protein [Solimonas soli]